MTKLGFTWYPKDWGNSENVFELNLSERGLYREFIDLAMLNDNKTEIKKDVWSRKFCVTIEDLDFILNKLIALNLIEFRDNILFIPSCESRLKLVRGGRNGGKKSKPNIKPNGKPILKPFESLDEKNAKPIPNQRETKREIESKNKKEIKIPEFEEFKIYALTKKQNVCLESLKLKYDSWFANGWKNGNDKKIVNWQSTLLNTLPYIKTKDTQQQTTNYTLKLGKHETG